MPAAPAERGLGGRVALVTGASRGVGRGVAMELAASGATVIATGRSIRAADLPHAVQRVSCDHTNDAEVSRVFDDLVNQHGHLDILVNSAWGGYEGMVDADGNFSWPAPFWKQPTRRWHGMFDAGVRAAFVASAHAARLMLPQRSGLIVNLSYWAAQKHLGNVLYGMAKAATDKLTRDAAEELRAHGVSVVSLYPGLVRTEAVLASGMSLDNSESAEFCGRAIAALANDADLQRVSGEALVVAALAECYGFTDIDGTQPRPLALADA